MKYSMRTATLVLAVFAAASGFAIAGQPVNESVPVVPGAEIQIETAFWGGTSFRHNPFEVLVDHGQTTAKQIPKIIG